MFVKNAGSPLMSLETIICWKLSVETKVAGLDKDFSKNRAPWMYLYNSNSNEQDWVDILPRTNSKLKNNIWICQMITYRVLDN